MREYHSFKVVRATSSTSRELRRCQREQDFIGRLVSGDPEPGRQGLYLEEITRGDIVRAMVKAGLVNNPNSYWGKFQVKRNLDRVHRTDYWRGYSFIQLTKGNFDFTLYKVRMDDVSGVHRVSPKTQPSTS